MQLSTVRLDGLANSLKVPKLFTKHAHSSGVTGPPPDKVKSKCLLVASLQNKFDVREHIDDASKAEARHSSWSGFRRGGGRG